MKNAEFKKLYQGNFELSQHDIDLIELAKKYHDKCNAYDDIVCSGRREGVSFPVSHWEVVAVNKNALKVRSAIIKQGERKGYAPDVVRKAIQKFNNNYK